jgi:hypothetical protein
MEPGRNVIIEVADLSHKTASGHLSPIRSEVYSVLKRRIRLRSLDKSPSPPDRAFIAGSTIGTLSSDSSALGGGGLHIPGGSPANRFAYDDQNVRIQGVFGNIDICERFETTLAADLSRGATSMSLTDTDDLQTNDVLLVDKKFWVIVGSVTTPSVPQDDGPPVVPLVPGVLALDPSPGKALSGAPVVFYGKVHRLIREAAVRTALAHQYLPGSEEEQQLGLSRRIKREETDNYEIEFFQGGGVSSVAPESGTGDPMADAILSRFRAPTVTGSWA